MSADLVSQLHPARLPADFTQMGWPDLLAGLGLGLLLAALILFLAIPFLRARPRPASLARRLRDCRALPAPDRLLALTRIHADQGAILPDDLRNALYVPNRPDQLADQIEALILGLAPKRHADPAQMGTRE